MPHLRYTPTVPASSWQKADARQKRRRVAAEVSRSRGTQPILTSQFGVPWAASASNTTHFASIPATPGSLDSATRGRTASDPTPTTAGPMCPHPGSAVPRAAAEARALLMGGGAWGTWMVMERGRVMGARGLGRGEGRPGTLGHLPWFGGVLTAVCSGTAFLGGNAPPQIIPPTV